MRYLTFGEWLEANPDLIEYIQVNRALNDWVRFQYQIYGVIPGVETQATLRREHRSDPHFNPNPWNAPNKVFNPTVGAWQRWPTPLVTVPPGSPTTQPVLFEWSPPNECTFGSRIPGMQFPDQECCRLSDATLRWYCPEPPPGFSFFPK